MTGHGYDSSAAELFTELADELLTATARGLRAMNTANSDTVSRYIVAQGVADPADYQLPEPILHPVDNQVLVVGFNPNYGEDEVIPRCGNTHEEYVGFYADRFAPHRRDAAGRPAGQKLSDRTLFCIDHYTSVERLVAEVLETEAAFGVNTVYCDAIPWKWKKHPFRGLPKVHAGIASDRLEKIVLALRPKVILTLGDDSSEVIADWHRNKPRPRPVDPAMLVPHVPSPHPARWGRVFEAQMANVQASLRAALKKANSHA